MEGASRLATMTFATPDRFLHCVRFCIRFLAEKDLEQCVLLVRIVHKVGIVGRCSGLGHCSILGAKTMTWRFQRLRLCTPIDFKLVVEMHVLYNISFVMGERHLYKHMEPICGEAEFIKSGKFLF